MDIQDLLNTAAKRQTVFVNQEGEVHDRTSHVGGSEVYGCLRRTWYSKNNTEQDPDFVQNWGFFQRGHNVEDWGVGLVRDSYPEAQLLFVGEGQRTLVYKDLAVTPDGLLVFPDGSQINLEFKSLDPRSNLDKPKLAHLFQTRLQTAMFHACTDYRPTRGALIYINASDYSDMRLHWVEPQEDILEVAQSRAELVFNADNPMDLPAEGAWADECQYCAYTEACGAGVRASMPTEKVDELEPEIEEELSALIADRNDLDTMIKRLTAEKNTLDEELKTVLRQHNLKSVKTESYSISYSLVAGRKSLDTDAMIDDGIDLSSYWKEGKESERLTVRTK